jgi:GNAT superfamily N-acetyltransferase
MKSAGINFRHMESGDENGVLQLILEVFDQFVAPGYSMEGIQEFGKYIDPDKFRLRLSKGHFCILAENNGRPMGVIEVRGNSRVSLLFVKKNMMGKGTAKGLIDRAIHMCRQRDPDVHRLEVNSSPYAVPVYERSRFHAVGPRQIKKRH